MLPLLPPSPHSLTSDYNLWWSDGWSINNCRVKYATGWAVHQSNEVCNIYKSIYTSMCVLGFSQKEFWYVGHMDVKYKVTLVWRTGTSRERDEQSKWRGSQPIASKSCETPLAQSSGYYANLSGQIAWYEHVLEPLLDWGAGKSLDTWRNNTESALRHV